MTHCCQKVLPIITLFLFPSHLTFCTLLYDARTETTNYISPSLDGFLLGPFKKKRHKRKAGRRKHELFLLILFAVSVSDNFSSKNQSTVLHVPVPFVIFQTILPVLLQSQQNHLSVVSGNGLVVTWY